MLNKFKKKTHTQKWPLSIIQVLSAAKSELYKASSIEQQLYEGLSHKLDQHYKQKTTPKPNLKRADFRAAIAKPNADAVAGSAAGRFKLRKKLKKRN